MAAFALVPALRGGRGPAAAAMALGRRRLAGADPSHAPTMRWFASGNGNGGRGPVANGNGSVTGGPVANGNGGGTGGSGAGVGAARSWTGCTGACAKEVLDLRAEMLWNNHQLWMRVNNLAEENVALRALIVKNEVNAKSRLVDLTYKLLYSGVAASIASFVYYVVTPAFEYYIGTPAFEYWWFEKIHELAEREREEEESAKKPPKEEKGAGAGKEKPPKEEEVAGADKEKPPKEEEVAGADKEKPPKEEEVGGPKKSPKVGGD